MTQFKIGETIAAFRKARGLTQEQLARKLGVSAPAVSKWETDSSYPDITLLCPLARALDITVDTLLHFEATLSDQEVAEQINTIIEDALQQETYQEEITMRLQALLRKYPNCTSLKFNAALTYDALQMFFPSVEREIKQQWQARKSVLLEEVRAAGSAAYWQIATIQLAAMYIADGALDKAEDMLNELPEHVGDPSSIWTQYYLKKGNTDQALKVTQKQLYKLVSQLQTSLIMLMNPKLFPEPEKQLKVCRVYQTMAQAFGFMDMSGGLLMEIYLRMGETEQAADCFAEYVAMITGPAIYPDEDLFTPGLTYQQRNQATTKEVRRMLLKEIEAEQNHALQAHPVFIAALQKLKNSI